MNAAETSLTLVQEMQDKMIRKADIIIIAAVMLCAVIMLAFRGSNGKTAVIEYGGNTVCTVDLSKDQSFVFHGDLDVVITVKDGAVFFESSMCRDKTCMSFGKISKEGQIAVCLPARVSVRITGNGDVDGVTG